MHLDSGESDINDTFSESEEKQQTSIGNGLIVEDKKVRNAKEESNEKCGSGKIFPNIFYADNVGNKRLKKGMLGKH